MARKNSYTADDIKVLTDREHVRFRLPIYAGNVNPTEYVVPIFIGNEVALTTVTFAPATLKNVGEIIDNCTDEFSQYRPANPTIRITAAPELGTYTIADNGRGVPIDKHETGKYVPEVVFGSLRSGRNFTNDKEAGVIGMNGIGSSMTNFVSTEFHVKIQREGKVYRQSFSDGANEVTKPSIKKGSAVTGTEVSFTLDPSVFVDHTLPPALVRNRAMEVAFTNPGITVEYNGEKFRFRKGLEDVVKDITKGKGDYHKFEYNENNTHLEFYVIFGLNESIDEKVFTWVNSSLLFDGGICNTQFTNAFYDRVVNHLASAAKKNKCEITKNDIRRNLLIFGSLKVANPEYDAQSKTRMTGPNLRKEMAAIVDSDWKTFARKNKQWLDDVLEYAINRHHNTANKKAIKDQQKKLTKKVAGLVDATSRNRSECQLLVMEGLSAASMVTDARNPATTASYPLSGKINNVYGTTPAQLMSMGKVTDLLAAIGLIPGKRASRDALNYGRVVITTDADHDGSDIFTLLANLFYSFWPELFDSGYQPFIYRLVAPNVCAVKGKKRVHFANRADFDAQKHKYKGWEISYYKGLGSMDREDWEMILSGETDTLIPIVDDGNIRPVLDLLFGPDADARKTWLQGEQTDEN